LTCPYFVSDARCFSSPALPPVQSSPAVYLSLPKEKSPFRILASLYRPQASFFPLPPAPAEAQSCPVYSDYCFTDALLMLLPKLPVSDACRGTCTRLPFPCRSNINRFPLPSPGSPGSICHRLKRKPFVYMPISSFFDLSFYPRDCCGTASICD